VLVTLCGSTRFESEFIKAQRQLSVAGIAFFSLAVLPQNRTPGEDWSDLSYDKIMADIMYFDRIIRSDAILLLGDGYIGFSTAREILWADVQGKGVAAHRAGTDWAPTLSRLKIKVYPDHYHIVERAKMFFRSPTALCQSDHTGQDRPFGYEPE